MSDIALRDLATVEYGKSPNGVRVLDSNIPICGTGGVFGFASSALFSVPLTVVARKGTLGKPYYVDEPCWIVDTAYGVITKPRIDPKWLFYSLDNFELELLNEATGVPSISRDYLYRVRFHTPPLPEQRKIASILTTVDSLIEQTEALIEKYRHVKQGMMADLLSRGVDEHGKLRPTQKQAPELYKQSELGWIPKEWEVRPVDDVCHAVIDCKNRTPPDSSTGFRVVKTPNIRNGRLIPATMTFTTPGLMKFGRQEESPLLVISSLREKLRSVKLEWSRARRHQFALGNELQCTSLTTTKFARITYSMSS